MDYLQIEYFIQVAKTENVSLAAKILNISQASLSQMIIKLEKELGTQLFDRKGRRIVLNEAGKRFLNYATISMDALHEARKSISGTSSHEVKGNVAIGMITPASVITDCIWAYAAKYPFVNFTINSIAGQENAPENQELDFLIGYDFTDHTNYVNSLLLGSSKRYIIVPEEFGAGRPQPYRPNDILGQNFVSLIISPGKLEIGFIRLAEKGYHPNIRFSTNNALIKRTILEAGIAAGFANEYTVRELKQTGRFRITPNLDGMEYQEDIIKMFYHEERTLSRAARTFVEFAMDWFNI